MGNCSSLLTKPCLGVSDIRYDSSASNNLVDQDLLWSQYTGYWGPILERRNTLSEGNAPREPSFYNPIQKAGWPYKSDVFTSFRMTTTEGTRFKSHRIYFYMPASAEFCSQTPPDGMRNTVDPNQVCGHHGNVQVMEEFGTSTFEKDGVINLIWVNVGPESDESSGIPSQETRMSTVDGSAVFTYVNRPGVFTYSLTETFYGDGHDHLIGVGTGASDEPGAPNFKRQAGSLSAPKINVDELLPALKNAYEEHNIVEIPAWVKNGEEHPNCLAKPWGRCPTENDWCSQLDPSCNVSMYQEPSASLNGVGIALVSVITIGIVSFSFYFFKRYMVANQRKRYTTHFAKQMADHLGHTGSISQLDPVELQNEFNRIDGGLQGNDGLIQKDELWAWVQSGKMGVMSKNDFDALFAAIDVDGDGDVSFLEFCGFMARCGSAYDKEAEALLSANDKQDNMKGIAKMVARKKIE